MGEGEEERREAELELAGRGSRASHVGSAVSKAVLGSTRGKPTPARSSAVPSSLPPAASSPPPNSPSSPATCCFCLENLVGGRREELLDLTPSPLSAGDPCPPWSPPDSPLPPSSDLSLPFTSFSLSFTSFLPLSLSDSPSLSSRAHPLGLGEGEWEGVRGCWGGKWGRRSGPIPSTSLWLAIAMATRVYWASERRQRWGVD